MSEEGRDWDMYLPAVAHSISPHIATRLAPFFLTQGREASFAYAASFRRPPPAGDTQVMAASFLACSLFCAPSANARRSKEEETGWQGRLRCSCGFSGRIKLSPQADYPAKFAPKYAGRGWLPSATPSGYPTEFGMLSTMKNTESPGVSSSC